MNIKSHWISTLIVVAVVTLLLGMFSPPSQVIAAPASTVTLAAAPTPLSPNGIIAMKKPLPTFKWSSVGSAPSYLLEVYRNTTKVYALYLTSDLCNAGTCTFTPETRLTYSAYKWRVAVNGGSFSPFKTFILTHVPWNINDGFPGDMMLWETMAGGKWSVSNSAIYSNGLPFKYSSIFYTWSRAYSNFEYESKLKVEGSPVGGIYPEAYMAIRMDRKVNPTNLAWYSGYLFGYSSNGKFSVSKMNNDGTRTVLVPPTFSAYIHKNGSFNNWNWLRVEALGNQFFYYMNDKLLVSVKDSSYNLGYIGFEMKNPGTTPTMMYVDWVTLRIIP